MRLDLLREVVSELDERLASGARPLAGADGIDASSSVRCSPGADRRGRQ